ncbi:MAG: SIS domain-containing protein [Patescibacteria group bacterium]
MDYLDSKSPYRTLDRRGMLRSIESLALQCQQAWDEARRVRVPASYRRIRSVVINGMGGSGLGGHIIDALFGGRLRVPFTVVNSYTLPGWVGRDTLYVLSSYSGTTEEVLATVAAARRRRAKLMVICAGGKLAAVARRYRIPAYIFTPNFNPCNQPRMGLGYAVVGLVTLLRQCGLLQLANGEFRAAVQRIVSLHRKFGSAVPAAQNAAKRMAHQLHRRVPIVIAAGHLAGNAHALANQINENSKNFTAYFTVSELNHHLLEGLRFPATNRSSLMFLSIESGLYLPRIQQRFAITRRVLARTRTAVTVYRATSPTALGQVFEVLLFGSYVNYYLALLNRVDPSPIPYVDYFKQQLDRIVR